MHPFQLFTRSHSTQQTALIAAKSLLRSGAQIAIIGISSIAFLSGCQATKGLFGKIDNGSLAYKDSTKLDPLQLPADQETGPFIPLHPTPPVGANTLDLENETGKRYKLPAPYRQVPTQQQQ